MGRRELCCLHFQPLWQVLKKGVWVPILNGEPRSPGRKGGEFCGLWLCKQVDRGFPFGSAYADRAPASGVQCPGSVAELAQKFCSFPCFIGQCQEAAATVYVTTVPAVGEGHAGEDGVQGWCDIWLFIKRKLSREPEGEGQGGGHV